jgi:hypothetical protein
MMMTNIKRKKNVIDMDDSMLVAGGGTDGG